MQATNLSTFSQMTELAKEQNLDYKILYSHHHRRAANNFTEIYTFILCTPLFTVTYSEKLEPENTRGVEEFIRFNSDFCINLNFNIKIDGDSITLSDSN